MAGRRATRPKPTPRRRKGRGYIRRTPGPVYSEAARRLWAAIDASGLSTTESAARLGIRKPTLMRWLYGDRRADSLGQLACKREFGIEHELWHQATAADHALQLPESKAANDEALAQGSAP